MSRESVMEQKMSAIDEAINKLDHAMVLARDLEREVDKSILHQRLIGIILGIVIVAAVFWVARS